MRNKFLAFVLIAAFVFGGVGLAMPARAQTAPLTFWVDDTRAPIVEALGAKFTEEFGVEVRVQQLGFGDIRDQLKTAGPAGEGPDIIIGAHDWLGELVVNGLLEPMDLGDMASMFIPGALGGFTYEGNLYGIPYAIENVAFVYNPEIVTEVPKTWDEVKALSEAIVKEGKAKYGFIRQDGDPYHFFPIQTAFGGYVFGFEAGKGYNPEDLGIDNEGSIAALQWFESMVAAGLQPEGVDYDVMHALFEGKEAAMMITGPWALERIRKSGVPYAVATIPAGPAGAAKPFLGVQGFMINSFSKQKDLAKSFLLDFVLNAEITITITDAAGTEMTGTAMELLGSQRPSSLLALQEKMTDKDLIAFGAAGAEGLAMPNIPQMASVWDAWGKAVEAVAKKQVAADEAFKTAAEQIRTLIKQ
ncbi:MAG: maltose/maltodextrin ABC transporter substrate-binding protein MalE [Anaerolineae bacterium]